MSVSIGDVDEDGHPDLLINTFGGALLYRNHGNGAFASPSMIAPVLYGRGCALADVNRDGHLDAVVVDSGSFQGSPVGTIQLLTGDGKANFQLSTKMTPMLDHNPIAVRVADFDGDGRPDIAVSVATNSLLSVWIADGNGMFREVSVPAPGQVLSITVADVDGNGSPDLVGDLNGQVAVWLNDGHAAFGAATLYAAGSDGMPDSNGIAAGDLNGDGVIDLVTVAQSGVQVLSGMGGGMLTVGSVLPTCWGPAATVIGDFNGDARPDVAIACWGGVGQSTSILFGTAGGGLLPTMNFPGSSNESAAAAGDLDGDGIDDLVVTDEIKDTVALYRTH